MTASVPEFEKRTSSAAGTIFAMRSATAYSRSVKGEDTPDLLARTGRGVDARVGVAQDAGAVGQPVVDVFVAVDVGEPRPLPRLHVDGLVRAPVAEIRRNPEGEAADGLLELGVGLREASGHECRPPAGIRGSIGIALVSPKRVRAVHLSEYVFIHWIGRLSLVSLGLRARLFLA